MCFCSVYYVFLCHLCDKKLQKKSVAITEANDLRILLIRK